MKAVLDRITEVLMCILLVAMVLAACYQVFARFILSSPSSLTEEFLRYSLIWLSMVGGAYAYGQGKHIAMVFLIKKVSENAEMKIRILVDTIVCIFAGGIYIYGGSVTYRTAVGQISAAFGMPMQFLYLSLIVSGVLVLFYAISDITTHIKHYKVG